MLNVFKCVCLRTPLLWAATTWHLVIGSDALKERRILEVETRRHYFLSKHLQPINHWSGVVSAEGPLLHYVVRNNVKVRSVKLIFCRRLPHLRVSYSSILFCGLVRWVRTAEKRNAYRVLMGKREGSMAFGRHVRNCKIMVKWALKKWDWKKLKLQSTFNSSKTPARSNLDEYNQML
jgi:hypothetical protein